MEKLDKFVFYPLFIKSLLRNTQHYILHIVYEVWVLWLFIRRDFPTVLLPICFFSVAGLVCGEASFLTWVLTLSKSLIFALALAIDFCIDNQLVGIEEDKLNKPDRPLVSGVMSVVQAEKRFYIISLLLPLICWSFGILEWAVLWQVSTFLYNRLGWSRYWFMKNILPAVGIMASLAGAWQILNPISIDIWSWILFFGIVWMTLGHVTDFRDIEGDKAIGRGTVPIVFGENRSRILISLCFGLLPLITHFLLLIPSTGNLTVYLWDIIISATSWIIAFRVLVYRTQKASEQTYFYFTTWYCLTLVSTVFLMHLYI